MTTEAKPAILCKKCTAETRRCDTCSRAGCEHKITPEKANPKKDQCGGCRLAPFRKTKKAAP